MTKENQQYKGNIAFFYRNSWYHRKKELQEDGKTKYSRIGGFKTPEEAEKSYYKYLEIYESQRRNFIVSIVDKEIMLKDYLKYWYENVYSEKIASTTAMITSYAIYNLIIPSLPYDIKVRLTTTDYINELLEKINLLGKTTAHKSREILNLLFKDAIKDNIMTVNPVENSTLYRRGKPNIKLLTYQEIQKLLSASCKGNWYLEILLGLFCGLRKGEIQGLKFSDFNEEKRCVKISRQLARCYEMNKGKYEIDKIYYKELEPKTDNSYRTLKVPNIIWDELEHRKQLINQQKIDYGEEYEDNGYISCKKDGKPHSSTSLNAYLKNTCRRNGIPEISVHGLRHIYATILIENGVALAKISALLGHGSIHTTFDFYCDVISEKERITALVNNKFSVEEDE